MKVIRPGNCPRQAARFLWRLLLVSLCLSLWLNPALAVELGKPPTFPKDLTGIRIPELDKALGLEVLPPSPLSVNPANREATRQFFNTYYLGAATPASDWNGNVSTCNAGTTVLDFKDAILLRLNFFRAMAGVPSLLGFQATYNAKDQQAALMMSRNNALNHSPPPTWSCYTAEGAEAAGNSNLALGACAWEAMDLYIADPGTGNGAAGHRRWILYPQTQYMGTGDIPYSGGTASNALWVFDEHLWDPRPATREEFVAWPPPGYVPYQVVYPRWSFAYAQADFTGASVSMKENGVPIPVTKETVHTGYGENTLVWIPKNMGTWDSWPQPAADTVYQVTINNVMISGSPRNFTYYVTVFDPATTSKRSLPWLPLLLE